MIGGCQHRNNIIFTGAVPLRLLSEKASQGFWSLCYLSWRISGKIQPNALTVAAGLEQATAGMKLQRSGTFARVLPKRMCRSEGGVTTQIDFHTRRKPAQVPAITCALRQKGRLSLINLGGNRLHPNCRLFFIHYANTGRVARKRAAYKSIYQV